MLRPRVTLTLLVLVLAAGCGPSTPPTPPLDLLITNARIVDGSGAPSKSGSVGIRGGTIVAVGDVKGQAARTIDAGGKVLAPGFIDMHSHSDIPLLTDGNGQSKIRQGVTT